MEIFVRILVRILDWLYGPRSNIQGPGVDPVTDALFRKYNEDATDPNLQTTAEKFVPDALPVKGAVDYDDLKWETFSRVVETPVEFSFLNGRNIAKVIAKSEFSSRQEIRTLRRVIRRQVPECVLLDD
jgi:hypothetical protein